MGDLRCGEIWRSLVSIFALFAALGTGGLFVLESVLEQERRAVCIPGAIPKRGN